MTPIIAWLLKSILCSGILYSYYLLFLKDKIFNKYNRLYLLGSIVLSLLLPFVHFSVQPEQMPTNTGFQMLTTVIATGGENFDDMVNAAPATLISMQLVGYIFYAIPAIALLLGLCVSIIKICRLYKRNQAIKIEEVIMVTTDDAPGTPFSFFNFLFWNKNINLQSDTGKKILSHELVHIQQKHSVDKVVLQIIQCLFWANPFIWLIKREVSIIHEFLADEEAVAPGDTAAFAEMMLQSAYTGSNFSIANHLTYSSIKRRIKMINKNKNPKMNYLSRIIAIPVIAGLVFVSSAYVANKKVDVEKEAMEQTQVTDASISKSTVKSKVATSSILNQQEPIVVLLDAGHGGTDVGAKNLKTGAQEKDITLAIVKKIVELNKDENIKFILTRSDDETIGVRDRTEKVKEKVDLMVSIHTDTEPLKGQAEKSGLHIWVPRDEYKNAASSKVFGSIMAQSFTNNYDLPIGQSMAQRLVGTWILQALEVPSILIEAGYISNPKDVAFLTSDKGVTIIANNVLNGIKSFVNAGKVSSIKNLKINTGLSGKVEGLQITKLNANQNNRELTVEGYPLNKEQSNTTNKEVVVIGYASPKSQKNIQSLTGTSYNYEKSQSINGVKITGTNNSLNKPYVLVDGINIGTGDLDNIDPEIIQSVNVIKGSKAISIYGNDAKDGVIVVNTKKANPLIVIDGKIAEYDNEFKNLAPNDIQTINVIKDDKAIKLYGDKGKKGVIEVTTKKAKPSKYQ